MDSARVAGLFFLLVSSSFAVVFLLANQDTTALVLAVGAGNLALLSISTGIGRVKWLESIGVLVVAILLYVGVPRFSEMVFDTPISSLETELLILLTLGLLIQAFLFANRVAKRDNQFQ